MPIYEFYCRDCHTVYSFFSQRVDVEVSPPCPSGKDHDLERKPSTFATVSTGDDDEEDPLLPGVDEARLERAMDQMAGEFANLGEDAEENPQDLARMFRRFSELGGVEPGPMLEDMLDRLESGADLEDVESEFEQEFEDRDDDQADVEQFFRTRKALRDLRRRHPRVDDTLYFL